MHGYVWPRAVTSCDQAKRPGGLGVGATLLRWDGARVAATSSSERSGVSPGERRELCSTDLSALLAGYCLQPASGIQHACYCVAVSTCEFAWGYPGYAAGICATTRNLVAGARRGRGATS